MLSIFYCKKNQKKNNNRKQNRYTHRGGINLPLLSGSEIARQLGCSKSGVNDFLKGFQKCDTLCFPLPEGITNYAIAEMVYGKTPNHGIRDESFELPDYRTVHSQLTTRPNMTLVYQWNRYKKRCEADSLKYYSYRQFCERYGIWCDENEEKGQLIGQHQRATRKGQWGTDSAHLPNDYNDSMGLSYKDESCTISTITITYIIYELNLVFEKLKGLFLKKADECGDKYKEYPCYQAMSTYNFKKYNDDYPMLPLCYLETCDE